MSSPLHHPRYPLASKYDPAWVLANQMGPNALWLLEWLCAGMKLEPGDVLHTGGRGSSGLRAARGPGAGAGFGRR